MSATSFVRCINCHKIIGEYKVLGELVTLTRVKIRKVVSTELRTECIQRGQRGKHMHRHQVWQAIAKDRMNITVVRSFYNLRGRKMQHRCPALNSDSFLQIMKENARVKEIN